MKAVRFHAFGPPENLRLDDLPIPVPGEGQVLVRVHAAGVNPLDAKLRAGLLKSLRPIELPFLPGAEMAGVIARVGPNAGDWAVGQPVLGMGQGSYTEYTLAQHGDIHPLRVVDFDHAAASPLGLLTAWSALEEASVGRAQRVLVQGATGGVGLFVVQLAVLRGADVTGSCSAVHLPLVRSWGARPADYAQTIPGGFDVVIDAVGGTVLQRSASLVRPGGTLISLAEPVDPMPGIHARFVRRGSASGLGRLLPWLENGTVTPIVRQRFPLQQASEAHRCWESQKGAGRIILTTV